MHIASLRVGRRPEPSCPRPMGQPQCCCACLHIALHRIFLDSVGFPEESIFIERLANNHLHLGLGPAEDVSPLDHCLASTCTLRQRLVTCFFPIAEGTSQGFSRAKDVGRSDATRAGIEI